jgi:putative peptide zinc metalloprotease protein
LFHKGIASATRDAMNKPALLVLVFALALLSAGFHELGHAAATRYGGATPGGMGVGLYLVWPAFYTDVTDAYRLPRRDRLRVDLGGLYFNAIVSVVTLGVWELWRHDALLLLVGLQLLMMVKNLSPVIRSDGYHILADATGIPDLYAHIGPTLRRLIPWRDREPSALTGRARLLVTLWVLIVTPVLIAMLLGAIVLLPRLITTAWDSGHVLAARIPHQGAVGVLASLLQLFALSLPALGSVLVTQRIVRGALAKGWFWSDGRPLRRAVVVAAATGVACSAGWAWWPAGQYQAIQPYEHGTLAGFIQSPTEAARPVDPVRVALAPGRHLAVAMIPVGGATKAHPAFFFVPGRDGRPGVGILAANGHSTAFPFQLPGPPGPGDTQALAVNTADGTVVYRVAYAVITVQDGAPVTNTNGAYALADCKACAAVAVSFQVVLVVGTSKNVAPINAAAAVNYDCPSCLTVALANQIVVTLSSQPTAELVQKLQAALQQLDATSSLTSATAITDLVQQVQKQIDTVLQQSGQVATTPAATTTATTTTQTAPATTTATATTRSTTTTPAAATTAPATTEQTTTTTPATTTAATTTETTSTTTTTTTTP